MIGVAPPAYDPAAPESATTLPVGTPTTVRAYVRELLRRHRAAFTMLMVVNATAVIASMVGPRLLGGLVEDLSEGERDLHIGRTVALFAVALLVQTVFVRMVRMRGAVLGERMLADLREDFLVRSVGLPPGCWSGPGPGICSPGSPPMSTGWRTRCARPCRSSPSAWCGPDCCSAR